MRGKINSLPTQLIFLNSDFSLTLRNVHDGDGEPRDRVGRQITLDVIVEEPIGDGEIAVEELLPRFGTGAEFHVQGLM